MPPLIPLETSCSPADPQNEMVSADECNAKPRVVRFANRTKIYLVPALSDMTEDEVDSIWTTDEDSDATQAELVETIRAMQQGTGHDHEDKICTRGLEHMRSAAHLEQRKINKECVLRAVLDEQERQWSTGQLEDAEEIAKASCHNSEWARESAANLGDSDADFARRLHEVDVCLETLAEAKELCKTSLATTKSTPVSSSLLRLRKPQQSPQLQQALPSTSIDSLLNKRPSGAAGSPPKPAQLQGADRKSAGSMTKLRAVLNRQISR